MDELLTAVAALEMVNEEEAVPDPISMVAGENEHVRFAGRPSHESVTAPLIVAACEAATVNCAGVFPSSVTEPGEAVSPALPELAPEPFPDPAPDAQAGL